MQTMSTVKKSLITAVCIALCYVLPLLFHGIQGAGQVFCPMHIPVFLCGLVCGWQFGLLCGLAGPALSSALCGMPPVSILPSMMIELAVYGLIAGASVGQLFAAGYIPGLLMAVALMIAVALISKKRGYAPSRPRRATLGEIGRQALKSFWALFFPLGIIMGMRFGIFTPTEAGGVGVLYCLIVGKFVYKGLKKEHFIPILRETISGTATVSFRS